jgi:hypothetical protein
MLRVMESLILSLLILIASRSHGGPADPLPHAGAQSVDFPESIARCYKADSIYFVTFR